MKKSRYNDGYVLPYILVVIAVMGILVGGCLTSALRNFQAQEASVRRMRDLYAAEGMIERYVADLRESPVPGGKNTYEDGTLEADRLDHTVTVTAAAGGVEVTAELKLDVDKDGNIVCIEYSAYQISDVIKSAGGPP